LIKKSMRRRSFWGNKLLWSLAGLCLVIASCVPFTQKPTKPDTEADEVVDRLRQRQAQVQTFAGRGAIRIKTRNNQHYFQVTTASERPGRLRLQALDFMGRPAMTMAADATQLGYLDYRNAVLYNGPATEENFNRLFPLGLGVTDLITLLSGGQPLSKYKTARLETVREPGRQLWRLSLFRPGGGYVERLYLKPDSLEVVSAEIGPPDKGPLFRLEYNQYKTVSRHSIPHYVRVADLESGTEMIVEYKEVKVNPTLPSKLFVLTAPPGVRVAPISGQDAPL
jgi:hypothetical protein